MVDKVYEATFKLSKKCECTDVKNSKTIELKIKKRKAHRWITGFKIKIFDPKLDITQLQAKAENQANMLTSIVIIKSGSHTTASFSGYTWKNDGHQIGRGLTARYNIFQSISLDLTDANLAKIIKDNPAKNQNLTEKIDEDLDEIKAAVSNYQSKLKDAVVEIETESTGSVSLTRQIDSRIVNLG